VSIPVSALILTKPPCSQFFTVFPDEPHRLFLCCVAHSLRVSSRLASSPPFMVGRSSTPEHFGAPATRSALFFSDIYLAPFSLCLTSHWHLSYGPFSAFFFCRRPVCCCSQSRLPCLCCSSGEIVLNPFDGFFKSFDLGSSAVSRFSDPFFCLMVSLPPTSRGSC